KSQTHMAENFLGAEARQDFALGIKPNIIALFMTQGDFAAQIVQPVADRVAVIALVAGRFAEFVDDERIGHIGGIAHAQVNDVDAGAAFALFQIIDPAEQVWRQPLNALGYVNLKGSRRRIRFTLHGRSLLALVARSRIRKNAGTFDATHVLMNATTTSS